MSVPDDRRQTLAGPRNLRPRVRTAAPLLDRNAAVAIADERGVAVGERLVDEAVVGGAVVDVRVDEAAVEGRQQPIALVGRNHHRPAYGGVRRLVAARIERQGGARVVEPGHVGGDARIGALGAKGRHQHRGATLDLRAGRLPDTFAGQRVREDRLDRRRPGSGLLLGRLRGRPGRRQALQLRSALLRGVPAVVNVLDLVDQLVAVRHIGSDPLDAARAEGHARRPQHPVRIRIDCRRQQHEDDHDPDPPASPLAAARSSASLPSVRCNPGEQRRAGGRVSRIRRAGARPPQDAHSRHLRVDRPMAIHRYLIPARPVPDAESGCRDRQISGNARARPNVCGCPRGVADRSRFLHP